MEENMDPCREPLVPYLSAAGVGQCWLTSRSGGNESPGILASHQPNASVIRLVVNLDQNFSAQSASRITGVRLFHRLIRGHTFSCLLLFWDLKKASPLRQRRDTIGYNKVLQVGRCKSMQNRIDKQCTLKSDVT